METCGALLEAECQQHLDLGCLQQHFTTSPSAPTSRPLTSCSVSKVRARSGPTIIAAVDSPSADGTKPELIFCDNETNVERLYGGAPTTLYPKDGINDHVVEAKPTVNPEGRGTKAWVVRALDHHKKGNKVIVILSVHEPIYMLLEAGAKIVPEGRVRCLHKITDEPDPHPPVIKNPALVGYTSPSHISTAPR